MSFYNDKNKTYLNHWYNWAADGPEKEEMFQDIRQLVEDMIREMLPQIIEEYISLYNIDIQTRINGKINNLSGLRSDIERIIIEELTKAKLDLKI